MKTKLLGLFFTFSFLIFNAQNTSVPDDNFENFLETRTATGAVVMIGDPTSLGDGVMNDLVPTSKISGLTEINLFNQSIMDLTGIEDFASLIKLECRGNNLSSIDVSMLALEHLDISENNLSSIDVSSNTILTFLDVTNNSLMNINVMANTNLLTLGVSNNNLTSVDVSQNTNLITLGCGNIGLTTLDISANTALERLVCSNSGVMSFDLTNNNALRELVIYDNESLSSILLPNHPNLTLLQCYLNPGKSSSLSSIDVSMCPNLETFWCYNNNIAGALDLSANTKLVNVDCGENALTAISMPDDLDTLFRFVCDNNNISELDLTNNNYLRTLWCNDANIDMLHLPTTPTNTYIDVWCSGNNLTSLDVSSLSNLRYLWCYDNTLTQLNLENNLFVELVSCGGNLTLPSSSVTLPSSEYLIEFYAFGNGFTDLSFLKPISRANLQYFDVGNGNITSIDVSDMIKLIQFYCNGNSSLSYLDISNNFNDNLDWMWAHDTALTCVQVDNKVNADNKDTYQWQIPGGATYEEFCATAGVDDVVLNSILLYPNPVNNKLYLDLKIDATFSLSNVFGQEIQKGVLALGSNELDMENLSSGLYLLNLETPEGKATKKIIKN